MMNTIRLVLGWIMIALGAYVAVHPLWSHGQPVTPSIWLDMAFAAVFLLRGVMNLRGVRRARSTGPSVTSPSVVEKPTQMNTDDTDGHR